MWTSLAITLAVFFGMEGVAWATHRWLMHGPLWVLHASHHDRHRGLEWNDLFGVFGSLVAAMLIIVGAEGVPYALPVGLGMTLYGAAYFGLHDMLVHRRLGWIGFPKNRYLQRLVRAHLLHHASNGEQGAYGFLIIPASAAVPLKRAKRD